MQKLPLDEIHRQLGAVMAPYSGRILPLYYERIYREHLRVRVAAGITDMSYLGVIRVNGEGAGSYLDARASRKISNLLVGRSRYALFLDENGGILSDALCFREERGFTLTTPPGGMEALLPRLPSESGAEVMLDSDVAIISVLGRKSGIVLQRFTDVVLPHMAADEVMEGFIGQVRVRIVRSAFTGEDTYEIHIKKEHAAEIWSRITTGGSEVVAPVGAAAMNTLRIEACRPIIGFEMGTDTNPVEIGLDRYVDAGAEFVGSGRVEALRKDGVARKLVAVMVDSPRIAWRGTQVFMRGEPVGTVTTGGPGLTLQRSLAIALVRPDAAAEGAEVQFALGKQKRPGVIVKPPFYKKERR